MGEEVARGAGSVAAATLALEQTPLGLAENGRLRGCIPPVRVRPVVGIIHSLEHGLLVLLAGLLPG